MFDRLKGYRTYIALTAAALAALGVFLDGQTTYGEFIITLLEILGLAGLRATEALNRTGKN